MAGEEKIMTIRELSEFLRVHPTTIYRLLRQGRLPGFRVGSNWRFSREAIERWERGQGSKVSEYSNRGHRGRSKARRRQ